MAAWLVFGVAVATTRAEAESELLVAGATPELIQESGAGEGPAWHPQLGLLTSGNGHIYRRDRQGRVSIFRENAGSNGLLFDRQGRLLICEPGQRQVTRLEPDGRLTVLAERYKRQRFNSPNDLALDSQDRLYFTDPRYGDRRDLAMSDDSGRNVEGVYRLDPDGTLTRIITHEVDRPNGLAITPDDRYLYIADNNNDTIGGARRLWRFELQPDGSVDPSSRELVYDWKTTRGPDGIKLDRKGRLFVAAGLNKPNLPCESAEQPSAGVYIFSPKGKLLQLIPIPCDETTNCAFGGDDLRTLYVTAGGTLWSIQTVTPGQPVFPHGNQ